MKEYMELGLPKYLQETLKVYLAGLQKVKNKEPYLHHDLDFNDLEADINAAEQEGSITPNQAHFLRKKYLYE